MELTYLISTSRVDVSVSVTMSASELTLVVSLKHIMVGNMIGLVSQGSLFANQLSVLYFHSRGDKAYRRMCCQHSVWRRCFLDSGIPIDSAAAHSIAHCIVMMRLTRLNWTYIVPAVPAL